MSRAWPPEPSLRVLLENRGRIDDLRRPIHVNSMPVLFNVLRWADVARKGLDYYAEALSLPSCAVSPCIRVTVGTAERPTAKVSRSQLAAMCAPSDDLRFLPVFSRVQARISSAVMRRHQSNVFGTWKMRGDPTSRLLMC